jgi:prepilin-type N-terminal cleavage/methylation domain-containing protein
MFRKQQIKNEDRTGKGGFTLIEAVTALAIFSISILAVASLQVSSVNGNASARFSIEAATLAKDLLERLILLQYDPAAPVSEFDNANNGTRAYTDPTGRYTVDWNISAPNTPIDNAITLNVFVTWRANGFQRRYNLTFIKPVEI